MRLLKQKDPFLFSAVRYSFRWLFHPIAVFVILQILWVAVVVLWVVWFVGVSESLQDLARAIPSRQISTRQDALLLLVIGCVLIGMLAVGTVVLFAFGQKQSALIRQQRIFLSSVTHELRSPLAALQLAIETLQRPGLHAAAHQQILANSTGDIGRLRKLIDQILVSSRFDRGLLPFDATWEFVDVEKLLHTIVDDIQRQGSALKRQVDIRCPSETRLRTISPALTLIVGNLIENAIKYSKEPQPVQVYVENDEYRLLIGIRDHGIGLDRRERKRIFRMFHRSPRVMKLAIPGTGLGLYIANSSARVIGAKIWADSAGTGQGSTFFVAIPHQQEEQTL